MYFNLDFIRQIDLAVAHYWQGLSSRGVQSVQNLFQKLSEYTVSAVEHLVIAILTYIIVCLVLYFIIDRGNGHRFENTFKKAKRVLIVTAHPDDECMFFGPTIYKLTQETNCLVFILCLSTGNKEGLGKQRKVELYNACQVLGVQECNIFLYNHTSLQDDPDIRWREDIVAKIVLQYIQMLEIDTLVTFDKHGVSRHSNHCSLYYAIAYLSMEKKLPSFCKVYTLESINFLRKYWLILDIPISYILSTHRYILKNTQKATILNAMRQHDSQFVWFRKLYVRFSRYMYINTFQQLDLIDLELDLTLDD